MKIDLQEPEEQVAQEEPEVLVAREELEAQVVLEAQEVLVAQVVLAELEVLEAPEELAAVEAILVESCGRPVPSRGLAESTSDQQHATLATLPPVRKLARNASASGRRPDTRCVQRGGGVAANDVGV